MKKAKGALGLLILLLLVAWARLPLDALAGALGSLGLMLSCLAVLFGGSGAASRALWPSVALLMFSGAWRAIAQAVEEGSIREAALPGGLPFSMVTILALPVAFLLLALLLLVVVRIRRRLPPRASPPTRGARRARVVAPSDTAATPWPVSEGERDDELDLLGRRGQRGDRRG